MSYCRLAVVLTTALVGSAPGWAYEIYTWTDEDGVVHYSQWAPEETDAEVATLELERTNPLGYDPAEDRYSIENQADRIGAQWRAIAEEKAAREEAERVAALEERLTALERRRAQWREPLYRPVPGAFFPFTRHALRPHFTGRFHGLRERRPRTERGAPRNAGTGLRPGWSGPESPSAPAAPGFGRLAGD